MSHASDVRHFLCNSFNYFSSTWGPVVLVLLIAFSSWSFTDSKRWHAEKVCKNIAHSIVSYSDCEDDIEPPVLNGVPIDQMAECNNIPAVPIVTATDNCTVDPEVILTQERDQGDCPGEAILRRTWTVYDENGNVAFATQVITLRDTDPPKVFGVPASVDATCNALPPVVIVTATDNCTDDEDLDVSFEEERIDGACDHTYVLRRIWRVADECGNEVEEIQTITVSDNESPELINVPGNITVDSANGETIPNPANVTANDNCDDAPSVVLEESSEMNGCETIITRTWTVTDDCGNESSDSQIITVLCDESCDADAGSLTPNPEMYCLIGSTVNLNALQTNDPVIPAGYNLLYVLTSGSDLLIQDAQPTPDFIVSVPNNYTIHTLVYDPNTLDLGIINLGSTTGFDVNDLLIQGGGDICAALDVVGAPVVVTADCGCQNPVIENVVARNASCGNTTGSISIEMVEPNDDYSYQWSATPGNLNSTGNQQNNLPGGAYQVTITEINDSSCETVRDIFVGNTDGPAPATVLSTPATCAFSNGTANLVPTALNYTWLFDGLMTPVRSDLKAGVYTVLVEDSSQPACINFIQVTVQSIQEFTTTVNIGQEPDCSENTGTATVAVSGGSGNYTFLWSDGISLSNASRNDLSAGAYSVLITDDETGCIDEIIFSIDNGDVSEAEIVINTNLAPDCPASFDGTIAYDIIPAPGFALPFTVEIKNIDNVYVANGMLSSGNYCLLVFDANNCLAASDCFEVKQPEAIDVQISVVEAATCEGGGAIRLATTGGGGDYKYDWADVPGTNNAETRTDLAGGDYSLTVTDALGCTAVVENINIPSPADCTECENPIVTNIVVIEATCDNSDGTATIDLNVNTADYRFSWTPNVSNNATATGLSAGTYLVMITDLETETCSTIVTFAVGNENGPEIENTTITPADCLAEDGTVTISPDDFTYQWSDNTITNNRDDLAAGNYFVTVTDPNTNCINIVNIVVPSENSLEIQANINQQSTCGDNNGSVSILVTGGSENYNYSWGSDNTRNDLAAGIYSVTVVDPASGCQTDIVFVLEDQLSTATISLESNTVQLSCAGDTNGTVNFTVNPNADFNGIPNAVIVNPDGDEVDNGELIPGNYCILVFDANNCLVTQDCFEVIGRNLLDIDIQTNDESCSDKGFILVATMGGNAPYTFDWSDVSGNNNDSDRNNLDGGNYSLTVTDASGCTAVAENIILENATGCNDCEELEVTSIVVREATCNNNDGAATIDLNLNTDDYTFNWMPNVANGATATGLSAGTYEVEIINNENENCTTTVEFAVGNSDGPETTSIDILSATCLAQDGSVTLLPTDYTYTWSDNQVTNSRGDLAAGTYFITVNDVATNCLDVIAVVVALENGLEATATINQNPQCGENNGSVTIEVTGGSGNYGYSWGGNNTRDNLASGIYNITVADPETGCSTELLFALNDNVPNAEINIENENEIVTISCAGDANGAVEFNVFPDADFDGTPQVTIVDENGVEQINGALNIGTYCILVTDDTGCLAAQRCFAVEGNELLDIDVIALDKTCLTDGSISLVTTGGVAPYTFDWADIAGNDNGSDRTGLSPESYSVTITDSEGCRVVVNDIDIIDTCIPANGCDTPILENTVKVAASCGQSNGSVFLEMIGDNEAFTYNWTPNVSENAFANNLPAGVYSVVISRLSDPTCQTTTTFAISNADGPQPEIISTTPATCNETNGTAVLGPVNYQYEWCNGLTGFSVNNLPAGSCFVTVTDFSTGCLNYVEIVIESFNPLAVTVNIDELPGCNDNDGEVSIDVANGSTSYTYAWSDGGGGASRDDLTAGFYTVTVTDNGSTGCEQIATFVLLNEVDAAATVTIDANPVLLNCIGNEDGMVDFSVATATGFAEPFSTTIFTDNGVEVDNGTLGIGAYCIVVSDADGCIAGQECFRVEEPTAIVLDIITQNETCDTTGMIFVVASGGNGNYTYDWQDIPGPTDSADRTNLTVGAYTLIVTDQNGCTAIADNLPIIDECSNCPNADTVNVNLPVNSLTEYCFELESCFDSMDVTFELQEGGFAGLSDFGTWDLNAAGCLTYTSNGLPGTGIDTICIIANDNGLPDTTCVIISITTDCGISNGDTLILPTFDCEAGADFCLPIGILDIDQYEITDNGMFYNGDFIGCQSDTSLTYRFDNFLIDFPAGPYQLTGWPVNGSNVAVDTFFTIAELFTTLSTLDPAGNWELEGNNIITRSINGTYGAMALRSYASSDQRLIQGEINIDNDGTQLSLDAGFHQLITLDTLEGCVDTFNVLVDCRNCPGIYTGPVELVAENCDGTAPVCVDLSINQIIDYRITDNGAIYSGGFLGCDIDSLVQYDVTNLFELNLFSVEEWSAQGEVFSADNLTSPQQLVDSMNTWFPAGNWRLDEFLILGDNFNNNYGAAVITLGGIPIENIEPGLQPVPNGLELAIDTGFHQIIVENLREGCVDTLALNVICRPCLEDVYLGETEIASAECEALTPICLELTVPQILNYEVTDNGLPYTNGFLGCNVDTTVLYDGIAFSTTNAYTLNSWQVNNNFFSMGQFNGLNELRDSMNVWDPAGDWVLRGTELIGGDLNNIYGDMVVSQFGIIIDTAEPGFNLQPQGAQMELDTGIHQIILRDSIAGCIDTFNVNIVCDDFVPLPMDTIPLTILINFTDTFCMDTTVLPGIIDTIFNICADSSGTNVNFTIDPDTYCVRYQGIGIGTDPACIVLCDDAGHCDTTVLLVTVIPPMSESITTEIFFGEEEQVCIDTTELAGNIDTIFNACPELSSNNDLVEFIDEVWCVMFESVGLGQDTACIVICDDLGICDTTFFAITNLTLLGEGPVAIDDDTLTVINESVIIDILENDTVNGGFISLEIINGPANGTAFIDPTNNTFIYTPAREFCGVDSFQYVLSTSTGQDTATVTITILCEELTIFNGFSPNGDGVNDNFIILGIERFPNNRVQIFNRWGNKVYDQDSYTNDDPFDGSWTDKDLPGGTYFYLIEDGEGEQYSGWLQIHR